eukprot:2350550-Prymnesium_polylepis.1
MLTTLQLFPTSWPPPSVRIWMLDDMGGPSAREYRRHSFHDFLTSHVPCYHPCKTGFRVV